MRDQDIKDMCIDLAIKENDSLDYDDPVQILLDGCIGYNNMKDEEIRKLWKALPAGYKSL